MATLNVRQQFIKNCFGEIKVQISNGIASDSPQYNTSYENGKSVRTYSLSSSTERRAQLFNEVKKAYENTNLFYAPKWKINNVNDKDVFDAIVTFYLICDYYGAKYEAVREALNHFAGIAAYRIFPTSLKDEGAKGKTHQLIRAVLTAFGVVAEDNEGDGKDDDEKMTSLINEYWHSFHQKDGAGNLLFDRDGKWINLDGRTFANTSAEVLHFNRIIRNAVAHGKKEFEPRLRQEVTVQFLYNYIIAVYMLKYVLRKPFNADFADYYERNKGNYDIPVFIKEVKEPTNLKGGEQPIHIERDGSYKLSPFTTYQFEGYTSTFDLNEYCYNATITPPSQTNYDTVIDLPQEGLDPDLIKKLETLQKTINDKIGEGLDLDEMRKIVNEEFEKLGGLFEVCNAIKTDVADLKGQQANVKKDLESILEKCTSLDEIQKRVDKLCESDSYKILIREKAVKKINWKLNIIMILACACLLGILYMIFHIDESSPYNDDDPDIAYEYAQMQEKEKNFPKAAAWYKKAIAGYKKIVEADAAEAFSRRDSSVTEACFRLAWMYAEAKGGIFDRQQALQYASKIKETERGIGLYSMLVEDIKEAEEQFVYLKDYKKDDFMLLAEAMWQLGGYGQCQTDSCFAESVKTLEQLIAKKDSPVRGEALRQYGRALIYGYGSQGNVKYSLYEGMDKLKKAALQENHIVSQVDLARKYQKMGFFDESKRFYELALSNEAYQVLNELVALAELADYPKTYLDSLDNIKHSLIQDSLIVYLDNSVSLANNGLYEQAAQKRDNVLKGLKQNSQFYVEDAFYKDLMVLKLKANVDLNQIVSDTMLVKCPLEKRAAYANYLWGIKYAQGYGVEEDLAKSDSLIQLAANDSITDAIYTWGNLLHFRYHSTLAAIAELKKIEDKDDRALELLSYIYKHIDRRTSDDYLRRISDDTRLYKVSLEYGVKIQELRIKPNCSLEDYEKCIRVLEGYLCRNGFSDKELSTVVAGYLAYLYLCMNASDDIIEFYAAISASAYLHGDGYQYLMYLSDMRLARGEYQKAEECYELFSLIFFGRPDDNEEYDSLKHQCLDQQVVDYMRNHFPGMAERVSEQLGKDITEGLKPTTNEKNKMMYTMIEHKFPYYPF